MGLPVGTLTKLNVNQWASDKLQPNIIKQLTQREVEGYM